MGKANKEKAELLEKIGSTCFWIGFCLEIGFVVLDKSKYILQYEFYDFLLVSFFFGICILCFAYNKKQWLFLILGGVFGLLSYFYTGRLDILRMVIFIVASSTQCLKKQFQVALLETGIGCMMIAILSFMGVGYALKSTELYRGGGIEETRYFFGMGHPNAFHCMFFVIMLLVVYVFYQKMKWYHIGFLILLNVVIYRFTDSNYGFICTCMALLCAMILKVLQRGIIRNIIEWIIVVTPVVASAVSVYFSYAGADMGTWRRIIDDKVLNGRINLAFREGNPDTWSLFSSDINTNLFDMGWSRLFYWYGWIPAVLFLSLLTKATYEMKKKYGWIPAVLFLSLLTKATYEMKKNEDIEALLMVFALSIYTMFEAHIISPYLGRNYLLLLCGCYFFSRLVGVKKYYLFGKSKQASS